MLKLWTSRVLLANIKNFGACPCPCCFVKTDQIAELGTLNDSRRRNKPRRSTKQHMDDVTMTRGWIFDRGYKITGAQVERVLGEKSWVPTHVSHPVGSCASTTIASYANP